jgi:hypothetical protein
MTRGVCYLEVTHATNPPNSDLSRAAFCSDLEGFQEGVENHKRQSNLCPKVRP